MACSSPSVPELPPPGRLALFLDIDGTLLEFAETPEGVIVPPALPGLLRRLGARLDGALGFITGRPLEQVDLFFPGVARAVAGEHGAALRHAPDAEIRRPALAVAPAEWRERAAALVARLPGALLEEKKGGFVLHYRQAPAARDALHGFLLELSGRSPGFEVMASNMAWELKPRGADKGRALKALLAQPPFVGRLPVFLGDDVTDRDAIAAAEEAGGIGLFVPEVFGGPAAVRAWLEGLAVSWGA